jgi:hypothetical protein
MTHKSGRIAEMVASFGGGELDARYLGFFDCFNRQLFYEAHEVLEDLWLMDRKGVDGDFYKGLIQLAGAFVHLQKERLGPCIALLRLARGNFQRYPDRHHQLDLEGVLRLTQEWEETVTHTLEEAAAPPRWEYPVLTLEPEARR